MSMDKQTRIKQIRANFPPELLQLNQWVCWRMEEREGKSTKVPYVAGRPNQRAESDKPSTWAPFEKACKSYLSGNFDGVSFAFSEYDPYTGVDFDHCVSEIGAIKSAKLQHISTLDSYTEFSQSGTGMHILIRATLPPGGRKSTKHDIEMYDHARFFVATGAVLGGFPRTINERQTQIENLHALIFPPKPMQSPSQSHVGSIDIPADDQTLLNLMFASKNGAKIESLWNGFKNGYGDDESSADLALCNHLAFWTGNDAGRMDRMFRQSRLYRDKWDRNARTGETYGEGTISRAITATLEVYTPPSAKGRVYTGNTNGYKHMPEDEPAIEETIKPSIENYLLAHGAHDEGNAQCVHIRHQGKYLHSESLGWLAYTGTHWSMDEAEAKVDRAITETLIARAEYSLKSIKPDPELIKRCIPNAGRVQGAKSQLHSLVSISTGAFDNEPDLLNCRNGVVDLRTGELSPHDPMQRFMHCTTVDYDQDADQDIWANWLVDAVGADMENWLQLAVGYSLTGHTREEVMFYLYGPPRSGKGTFTETILDMLGTPLADVIGFHTLTTPSDADTQNFNLAPLHSSRFIAASESNSYERFNEAKVKLITGGDKIQCSFKHKTPFSYRPKYKIWLSSNQPINADPDDDATWGRLRVIEFPHSHLGSEDKALKQMMRKPATLRGVLAWAVLGAIRWYQLGSAGLPELEQSRDAKRQQREALDNVQGWLGECCMIGGESFCSNSILYLSYERWCKENGIEPKKQKGFSQALIRKGYESTITMRESKMMRGFKGVGLR